VLTHTHTGEGKTLNKSLLVDAGRQAVGKYVAGWYGYCLYFALGLACYH